MFSLRKFQFVLNLIFLLTCISCVTKTDNHTVESKASPLNNLEKGIWLPVNNSNDPIFPFFIIGNDTNRIITVTTNTILKEYPVRLFKSNKWGFMAPSLDSLELDTSNKIATPYLS